MLFYLIYIILLVAIAGRYKIASDFPSINRKTSYRIIVFVIILVSALRFNVGFDWKSYLRQIYPVYNPKTMTHFEPLSALYIKTAGKLGIPLVMYALFAITNYLFIAKAIENYSVDPFESIMVYMCLFYFDSLSIMRQTTAVSITFYGFKYVREKKFFKYFLVCVIAMLFHKTAILAIPVYFLYYMRNGLVFLLAFFTIVFFKVVVPVLLSKFFPYFLAYYGSALANQSGNFVRLIYFCIYLYVIVMYRMDREYLGLLNICTIGIVFPFALGGMTGGRVAAYFIVYYLLLLPRSNKDFSLQYKAIFLLPFYMFFLLLLYTGKSHYLPFKWYFLEDISTLNLTEGW